MIALPGAGGRQATEFDLNANKPRAHEEVFFCAHRRAILLSFTRVPLTGGILPAAAAHL